MTYIGMGCPGPIFKFKFFDIRSAQEYLICSNHANFQLYLLDNRDLFKIPFCNDNHLCL